MKISRGVRFYVPTWSSSRDRWHLVGRRNSVHLQETALVVEGLRPKLWFPFVTTATHAAWSEWTMRTVPYSSIRQHRLRLRLRPLFLLFITIALASIISPLQLHLGHTIVSGLIWMLPVATFFVAIVLSRQIHEIEYELPDGRRCRFWVSFRSRDDTVRFRQRLHDYRVIATATERFADLSPRDPVLLPSRLGWLVGACIATFVLLQNIIYEIGKSLVPDSNADLFGLVVVSFFSSIALLAINFWGLSISATQGSRASSRWYAIRRGACWGVFTGLCGFALSTLSQGLRYSVTLSTLSMNPLLTWLTAHILVSAVFGTMAGWTGWHFARWKGDGRSPLLPTRRAWLFGAPLSVALIACLWPVIVILGSLGAVFLAPICAWCGGIAAMLAATARTGPSAYVKATCFGGFILFAMKRGARVMNEPLEWIKPDSQNALLVEFTLWVMELLGQEVLAQIAACAVIGLIVALLTRRGSSRG